MKRISFLITLTLASKSGMADPALKCSDLHAVSLGPEVRIESATMATPELCDVRGTVWPENKFAVKLPTGWNNRFYMVGNGGTAGTINHGAMDAGLSKGFATASTDTGHDAAREPFASFATPGPENPHAERKIIDFGYRAVHETAVLAKKIIQAYYGEAPRYSYWVGCSTGGRQGLSEAQRFPEDFDGVVVGAPVLNLTGTNMRHIWNARAQTGDGAIAAGKLPLLANAVYGKCDSADGLKDGLIDDPRRCAFDPTRDLPKCRDTDGPNCFTAPQVEALKKIYGGVKTFAGKLLFPGQPPGAEVLAQGKSGWTSLIQSPPAFTESYMKFIFLDPRPESAWNYKSFNFDGDPPRMVGAALIANATNPDLRPLKQRGGKIIHYHGWADPAVTALMSIDYYESVLTKMGDKETKDFYRLFLIPGMFHCRGGVGCDTVDWVSAIVAWVEKGTAPEKLIGSRVESGATKRTRPICPYPELARYRGAGSIDDAANFTCAAGR